MCYGMSHGADTIYYTSKYHGTYSIHIHAAILRHIDRAINKHFACRINVVRGKVFCSWTCPMINKDGELTKKKVGEWQHRSGLCVTLTGRAMDWSVLIRPCIYIYRRFVLGTPREMTDRIGETVLAFACMRWMNNALLHIAVVFNIREKRSTFLQHLCSRVWHCRRAKKSLLPFHFFIYVFSTFWFRWFNIFLSPSPFFIIVETPVRHLTAVNHAHSIRTVITCSFLRLIVLCRRFEQQRNEFISILRVSKI